MSQISKPRNLEERTFLFAQTVRLFVRKLPRTISNQEDVRQIVKSSGSVAANYIEANESLSKKDFAMRIKICRKEAKESHLWLRLLDCKEVKALEQERDELLQESRELTLIFSAIVSKTNPRTVC